MLLADHNSNEGKNHVNDCSNKFAFEIDVELDSLLMRSRSRPHRAANHPGNSLPASSNSARHTTKRWTG